MQWRGLALLLLCLGCGARRVARSGDSHQRAQQQSDALAGGLEASAEAREALIPGSLRAPWRRAGDALMAGSAAIPKAGADAGALQLEDATVVVDFDPARLRGAVEVMQSVLEDGDSVRAALENSPTVQQLAQKFPAVPQLLEELQSDDALEDALPTLQAELAQMSVSLQDEEHWGRALAGLQAPMRELKALSHAPQFASLQAYLPQQFPEFEAMEDLTAGEAAHPEMSSRRLFQRAAHPDMSSSKRLFQSAPGPKSRTGSSRRPNPKQKRAPKYRQVTTLDVSSGRAYDDGPSFQQQYDEVGVLPPLGRWDPLRIREQGPERYRRFVEMEIKHGRLAMAGFLGAITTYSGLRWPGYLSIADNIKFSDMPGAPLASWAALPTAAWFQIILFISFLEVNSLKQDPLKEPGDVVPEGTPWVRYPDGYEILVGDGSIKQVGEEELILGRTWKLNAERNNGRAAMMGMTGMLIHEALTGNPVFPIGES